MQLIRVDDQNLSAILADLSARTPSSFAEEEESVRSILEKVRSEGDAALLDLTEKFDGAVFSSAEDLEVTSEEIEAACASLDPNFIQILEHAEERIRRFHEKQIENSWITTDENGSMLGMRILPMDRVGVYVPGGKAAYPSSVLMNIVPANVAGVGEIIMVTPCDKDGKIVPEVLAAAKIAGADRIFRIGGAQAIAALAYGTATVPRVDKIVGPGNIYVALAKKAVFGQVSIDSVAGPSEILVLADDSADPDYVAADLLSQAEHDEMASAVLVTTDEEMAGRVLASIDKALQNLSRRDIIASSLENFGRIYIASKDNAIAIVNAFAPEHLEIQTEDPMQDMTRIRHAGAIFMGPYSSEPLGDYFAGPNHVLPTSGTARFFSPLGTYDFVKRSSLISYSRASLEAVHTEIEDFAKREQLTAHAHSVAVRFGKESE